jgi:hypothetical protein
MHWAFNHNARLRRGQRRAFDSAVHSRGDDGTPTSMSARATSQGAGLPLCPAGNLAVNWARVSVAHAVLI